ncbi:hypothetical protein ASPWEDRAFT_120199 [Aspergillus wentii DTO 134E9]|uniref:BTB domain-containing protein n=1 Tax=Aspergillus wentii DTO 134E9 TaxID=1073089 RepID=A0A1L9R6M0_ASPWE|nr:uncharacterized protein ASPWEDRAFT_120199 [Aspergillus wentii DTO 134E9]KAI9926766.1 hypothetical protein MW887_003861 [Aspergillus wentii]OJJ30572.1 hypothetical protein ASPWEDRAFT_120199 [Aspergillus wentii DTO 134E9]
MSSKLWEFFLRDDVESFRRVLVNASYTSGGQRGPGGSGGSPSLKKLNGTSPGSPLPDRGGTPRSAATLSRVELNTRDQDGRTLLHLAASSSKPTAVDFAIALLETPFLDIYAQDWESGWTALHRALYAGNATIAQALMTRDARDATDFSILGTTNHPSGGLIKIKDREGYSPFDVYMATIMSRDIKRISSTTGLDPTAENEDSDAASSAPSYGEDGEEMYMSRGALKPRINLCGDEVFTFGSNKNLNLGLGDQDDRQFPERVTLKRPEHLLKRFFREFQEQQMEESGLDHDELNHSADLPVLIKNKPIKFQNVVMSKLHTAILTDDPESNLFLCGFGPGGRLGTDDESTRFAFTCIETGGLANKKVISVALGQDHTLAITEQGEIFSWGSNKFGQLGYGLPRSSSRDDVPIQTTPRQIFNPFKKEAILGAAASTIHSVVFSSSGLYTFGKNEGQLGLVDSDARSLEVQTTPRRVGASLFSSPIQMVSAIDQATAILLQNHEVWIFSQYGYSKLSFPLDVSSRFIKDSFMATRYDTAVNRITKITSGGNTICALSSFGEVFTVQSNKTETPSTLTSTTNPAKTRNSLSAPVRAWSVKKAHMAVRDVDVGQDGSIIICTASGSAWTKEKRGKTKQGAAKDYKFARIPGLSRVVGVRSNAFGAYAVAQRDCNVTREQVNIDPSELWDDLLPLSPFDSLRNAVDMANAGKDAINLGPVVNIKLAVMTASDIESHFKSSRADMPNGTIWITTTASDARIPVHEFILTGRSPVLRNALQDFWRAYYFSMPDIFSIEYDHDGEIQIKFEGVDFLTILNIAFFLYTDSILDVWHQTRASPKNASRYRQVRTDVMRVATHLGLLALERGARLMVEPARNLKTDLSRAISDPSFFESGDVIVQLNGGTQKVHSQVVCQRCPFFDALFNGRSGGRWLALRRTNPTDIVHVDLKHIDRHIFDFVLRYLYADTEEQLFDEVRLKDLDDFIDLVLDVAFVANELMIDRLAQICQKMLGRFVNTRNVCHLLNSISPCSVKEFKDAALEYICLNLEDLVANRYLEDLDEDLLSELDGICHENQMACFPVSRGRNSDDYIFDKYPELVSVIESDRRRRIDSMRLRSRLNKVEAQEGKLRPTPSEKAPVSPSVRKAKSAATKEMPSMAGSPVLKPRQSTSDLMFQMDEETLPSPGDSMKGKAAVRGMKSMEMNADFPALGSSITEGESFGGRSYLDEQMASPQDTILAESPSESRATALHKKRGSPYLPGDVPWSSQTMSTSKKDLKDIMAEASENQTSNLSLEMSGRRESSNNATPKLSQKERKKIQQQQMQEMLAAKQKAKEAPQNPWKTPTPNKTPVKPELIESQFPEPSRSAQKPSMTLRQTVAGTPPPKTRPAPAPAAPVQTQTQAQGQNRSASANMPLPFRPSTSGPSAGVSSTSPNSLPPAPPAIQSVRHIPRPEPYQTSFHSDSPSSLSLATILLQQQTEKDEIREAATAKHNLEDIQAEQEFQVWWEKESRRIQGLPELDTPAPSSSPRQEGREGRGSRGGGRGKGPPTPGGPRKKRGKDAGNGNSGNKNASGASSLTQQLSQQNHTNNNNKNNNTQKNSNPSNNNNNNRRDNHPRAHGGNHHPDATNNHTRRGGGRGGSSNTRGRGKGAPQETRT